METKQYDFIAGARDSPPILLGVVSFALICSVAAVSVGLTPFEAMSMSFIVFAGASQLAVLQLMGQGAFRLVMVLTAWYYGAAAAVWVTWNTSAIVGALVAWKMRNML